MGYLAPDLIEGIAYLAPDEPPAVVTPGDILAPVFAGPLSFGAITHQSATVSWPAATDNVGVVGYRLQVNGGGFVDLGAALSAPLTALEPETQYTVSLIAVDQAGNQSAVLTGSLTTVEEPVIDPPPDPDPDPDPEPDPDPVEFGEPVTLAEAKKQLRVVFDDEDEEISGMITAARMMLEGITNRALVPRMVSFYADSLADGMRLPVTPYCGGLSIQYTDSNGDLMPLDPSAFFFDDTEEPARVFTAYGATWPLVRAGRGAVRITYQAGYEGAIPVPLKRWILMAITTMYEHRGSTVVGASVAPLPENFMQTLYQQYRVYV